jgi:energy-coupling factor transport system permease protein
VGIQRGLFGGEGMSRRFHTFHPAIQFFYYISSIFVLMIFAHPLYLLLFLLVLLSIHWTYDRFKQLKQWKLLILTTGMFILIMNPLFNERGRHLLIEIFGHRVTMEAVVYGGMSALTIIGIITLFVSYNEVMTPNKLLFLFSKFLPQFAILLMLTLRFIPLMRRRLEEISAVQMSKGINVYEGSWKERFSKGMKYIQILVTFSLEEAIQTADSMNARNYGENKKRTTYEYFRFHRSDYYAMGCLVSLFLLILYFRFLGFGVFNIYPIMEPIYLHETEILTILLTLIYMSFPLLVDIREVIRWRIYN